MIYFWIGSEMIYFWIVMFPLAGCSVYLVEGEVSRYKPMETFPSSWLARRTSDGMEVKGETHGRLGLGGVGGVGFGLWGFGFGCGCGCGAWAWVWLKGQGSRVKG
jgi:hypothetical protein